MVRRKVVLVLLILPFLLCFTTPAICQDDEDSLEVSTGYEYTDDVYESSEFGLGTVIGITENTVTLNEDSYDDEATIEVTYSVDGKTRFSNIGSLGEIKNGNIAYIDYIEKDGKKLILNIDIESEETE